MQPKVAVVTGSNKGIGFAIVKLLCQKFDGHVYLTARSEERGKRAVDDLRKAGLSPKFHQLDTDDLNSISRFRRYLGENYSGLDVLVNNAAVSSAVMPTLPLSEQVERIMNTNFFSTLNVCKELFPLLRPHGRVVNVSSSAGMLKRIPDEDIQKKILAADTVDKLCEVMRTFVSDAKVGEQKGWGDAYAVSKVGVTALTFIQQRAFSSDDSRADIVVNAVHPGKVPTDMNNYSGSMTAEAGADCPVYLALLPVDVKCPRGEFVWCDRRVVAWDGPRPDS